MTRGVESAKIVITGRGGEQMDPRQLFMDDRLTGHCVYCGARPDTRDHVPARALLDVPLPADFPVVAACSTCNGSFSLDEEYLACLLACVISGTADPNGIEREKISRSLRHRPSLASKLAATTHTDKNGALIWQPEMDRVRRVVVKLARGHAAYELHPMLGEPSDVGFCPLSAMSVPERQTFELSPSGNPQLWPEIGARAFTTAWKSFAGNHLADDWSVVQPDRYRYAVNEMGSGAVVRMVLNEYLACTVLWE